MNPGNDEERYGPVVEKSRQKSRRYSKRIVAVMILASALIILVITAQADFGHGKKPESDVQENYRMPQEQGFSDLIAGMQKKRRPAEGASAPSETTSTGTLPPEPQKARIVLRNDSRPRANAERKYYSNRNDAQAASQLRALKVQAIVTKPVVENFVDDTKQKETVPTRNTPPPMIRAAEAVGMGAGSTGGIDPAAIAALQEPDPNGQRRKQEFLYGANGRGPNGRGSTGGAALTAQGYSTSMPIPQQFQWELKAGTIIPGVLITGINSSLPGTIIGQVSENVWDSTRGSHILIPKGTRILGVYDSEIKFGQRRVLLVWNRLVFPNGTTLNIAGSPGIDQAGYSGLSDKVDSHWGQMFTTALFASLFVAGAETVYNDNDRGDSRGDYNKSPSDAAAESAANSILDMSAKLLEKVSDIQPTIRIRSGKRFGILIQKDVVFPFPYDGISQ